jgi:hypothetical protein
MREGIKNDFDALARALARQVAVEAWSASGCGSVGLQRSQPAASTRGLADHEARFYAYASGVPATSTKVHAAGCRELVVTTFAQA